MKLTIELVPSSSWYSNLRSILSKEQWDVLRKNQYALANYRCEICGGKGTKWPVECHEIWHYDDVKHIQRLDGLVALCPACHQVKHIGLAQLKGNYKEALRHLAKINKISLTVAQEYVNKSVELWRERSKYSWEIDLSWLDNNTNDFCRVV